MRLRKPGGWITGKVETREEWEERVRLAEQKQLDADPTPYEELQLRLVKEWRATHPAPNPYLQGAEGLNMPLAITQAKENASRVSGTLKGTLRIWIDYT